MTFFRDAATGENPVLRIGQPVFATRCGTDSRLL